MIKIRLVLLFAFIFLNTTAQNPYSQGIESLKIIRDNINNKVYEVSPEEYSKLVHQFKKKLDSIIERNKQIKKRKILNKKIIEFDLQEIYNLKAQMNLDMMFHGFGIKDNLDSLEYYRNEIQSIPNNKKNLARAHSFTAYIYNTLNNITKSIEHYSKALKILEFPENKELRPYQIRVMVNLNASLLELNIFEKAEENYNRLEETILDMSSNKNYKRYIELLKIEKSYIFLYEKDYGL